MLALDAAVAAEDGSIKKQLQDALHAADVVSGVLFSLFLVLYIKKQVQDALCGCNE